MGQSDSECQTRGMIHPTCVGAAHGPVQHPHGDGCHHVEQYGVFSFHVAVGEAAAYTERSEYKPQ